MCDITFFLIVPLIVKIKNCYILEGKVHNLSHSLCFCKFVEFEKKNCSASPSDSEGRCRLVRKASGLFFFRF